MEGEINVIVEGEESAPVIAEQTADVVIEKAQEIAELIVDAGKEGEVKTEEVAAIRYTLDDIYARIDALFERVAVVADLVMGVSDQLAAIGALEVAELIVEETPAVVAEVAETAELIEEVIPDKEIPVEAVTPQTRVKKKGRWL